MPDVNVISQTSRPPVQPRRSGLMDKTETTAPETSAQTISLVNVEDAKAIINHHYLFAEELPKLFPECIADDGTAICPVCHGAMNINTRDQGNYGRCNGECVHKSKSPRPVFDVPRLYGIRHHWYETRVINHLAARVGYVVTRLEAKADVDRQRELLAAALNYAAQGLHVFPVHHVTAEGSCSCDKPDCSNIGKHPITKRGLNDASTDPARIMEWWSWKPHANVGIRTGSPSGVFVVDVDCSSAKPGFETLHGLEDQYGSLPPTWQVRTGSGGRHFYFRMPTGVSIKSGTNVLGPGLDIRGEGGYAVAPPSNHESGAHYVHI